MKTQMVDEPVFTATPEAGGQHKKKKWPKRLLIALCAFVAIVAIAVTAFIIYASDYYPDKDTAHQYLVSSEEVQVQQESGFVTFGDSSSQHALVFYPGAKVEYTSYAPLMRMLAEKGIFCVIVEMPFNFAFFDIDAAARIQAQYPDIAHWWIGGHSLGGSMAANHVARNANEFEGVIFLASYSADDLSDTSLTVVSIYGSDDTVLNLGSIEKSRALMPPNYSEHVIEGGNHAYFGNYGEQEGDGAASILPEEQWQQAASLVSEAILGSP